MLDFFFFLFLLKGDTTTTGWRTWIQRQEKRTMPMKPLGIPHGRNTRSECSAGGGTGGTVHAKTYVPTLEERPINQNKKEWVHAIFNRHVQNPIQVRRYFTLRKVGTFNPVFGGVSMHTPHNKTYKNSLNRFLWNTVREIRTARAFLRWTCTMNICYNGTSKIHFGKYTKIIQQQKLSLRRPKSRKDESSSKS